MDDSWSSSYVSPPSPLYFSFVIAIWNLDLSTFLCEPEHKPNIPNVLNYASLNHLS